MYRRILPATLAALLLVPVFTTISNAQWKPLIQVKVERVKPEKEGYPTLRFFRENLDFLRSRLDGLQETAVTSDQETAVLDQRLLRYQEMLMESRASRDTLDTEQARREKQEFLSSVTELGDLEVHLDLLEDILARQESRLGALEEDFVGNQHTAMVLILQGHAANGQPEMIRVLDGFAEMTDVALRSGQLQSLEQGGLVQIYHALIEPREQTWEIALGGGEWSEPSTTYLTFKPQRNRLNYLMVNLDGADPRLETTGLKATAWFHDPSSLLSGGSQDR